MSNEAIKKLNKHLTYLKTYSAARGSIPRTGESKFLDLIYNGNCEKSRNIQFGLFQLSFFFSLILRHSPTCATAHQGEGEEQRALLPLKVPAGTDGCRADGIISWCLDGDEKER